jgi:hypothetical protein
MTYIQGDYEINEMKKEHNYQIGFTYEIENHDEPEYDNDVVYKTLNCWVDDETVKMCENDEYDWYSVLNEKLALTVNEEDWNEIDGHNVEYTDHKQIDRRTKEYRSLK